MIKCLGKACLFFTANRFARLLTKMAEESFFKIGLSPTEAFALMILNEEGAMGSSKLGQRLHLSPSTVTRCKVPISLFSIPYRKHLRSLSTTANGLMPPLPSTRRSIVPLQSSSVRRKMTSSRARCRLWRVVRCSIPVIRRPC